MGIFTISLRWPKKFIKSLSNPEICVVRPTTVAALNLSIKLEIKEYRITLWYNFYRKKHNIDTMCVSIVLYVQI